MKKKIIKITNYHGSVSGYMDYYVEAKRVRALSSLFDKSLKDKPLDDLEDQVACLRPGGVNSYEVVELEEEEVERLLKECGVY